MEEEIIVFRDYGNVKSFSSFMVRGKIFHFVGQKMADSDWDNPVQRNGENDFSVEEIQKVAASGKAIRWRDGSVFCGYATYDDKSKLCGSCSYIPPKGVEFLLCNS